MFIESIVLKIWYNNNWRTVPSSDARDVDIGNHGDLAPVAVHVEQDEIEGCDENILQQAKQQEGEKVSASTTFSYSTTPYSIKGLRDD